MLTSLFTAVSGMNANGVALSVIGDNVSNMNTAAFKSSKTVFGDVLSANFGTSQIGRGVLVNAITPEISQGSFESSANVYDMAIDGDGYFIVNDGAGNQYTRAGQFNIDKDGYVVNSGGLRMQGYLYSSAGVVTTGIGDISVAAVNSAPNDTNNVIMSANLDSRETVIAGGFVLANPDATSNFSSSITIYDSLGNGHVIDVYFTKVAEAATGNTWDWSAVVGASDSAAGVAQVQAQGTIGFDNNGALDTESAITYPLASGGFDFTGGAAAGQLVAFDFGDSITTEGGTGLTGTTQFGAESATIFQSQDGYSSGSLKNVTISQDGTITGIFTNGQTRGIARIALAKFTSPQELTKMGKNLLAESFDSGPPIISAAGSSSVGQVLANTLELSNVDLAQEFVKMIISQRGFQANSRVITTSDELMMELVNLKR
jgi:flagellar hook protein FlgE